MNDETIYVYCKKEFRGLIDIRDYIVKKAIDQGKTITVTCGAYPGKSVYTSEELTNPVNVSQPFTARYGDVKEYRLHSYRWKD